MRDLLNILDLMESKGLANRKPGDVFKGDNGKAEMYFRHIQFWPAGGGELDQEDLVKAKDDVEDKLNTSIHWLNYMPNRGGFGIATFDLPDGGVQMYGRYFQRIKPIDSENQWPNDSIPGFKLSTKAAAKTKAGMTPQDILTDQNGLDASGVIDQIAAKFGDSHPLTQVAEAVNNGQQFPISVDAPEGMSFTAFRDYFCELLHPIALQRGTFKGNAAEAEELFLGDCGYACCDINYGGSKTEGLSDSILIAEDGRKVKVSSKGAGGAEASVKNLLDSVEELQGTGSELIKKHKETIEILESVKKAGQKVAPVSLGVRFGIISSADAFLVADLNEMVYKGVLTHENILDSDYLSDNLKKLYEERGVRNPSKVNPFFHILAAIAHKVAEHVNNETDFSKAASEILNNAALVQVYTRATEENGKWTITAFDTVYPSTAVTGVLFSAQKGYYSTDIKGNFTFKILKGGASPKAYEDPPQDDIGAEVNQPKEKSDIKAAPKQSTIKTDKTTLGRAKR